MMPILMLRRARRDAAILVVWVALVAFAVALAIGQPRLLRETVDAGARQAVSEAGSRSDVSITGDVSRHLDNPIAPIKPAAVETLALAIPNRLPPALRSVYSNSTLTVLGPSTQANSVDGSTPTGAHPLAVQIAMLTAANTKALTLSSGALPGTSTSSNPDVDVVLSAASASAAGLAVGSVVEVATDPIATVGGGSGGVTLRVVGIVAKAGPGSATEWNDTPNLWQPVIPSGKSATDPIRITVLASETGVDSSARKYTDPFKAEIRIRLAAQKFTAAREAAVAAELVALAGHTDRLAGATSAQLSETSEFGPALADFPGRERATVAQVSIMTAGVLGVAAAVLLLVSRMLVLRREAELALERARGASLVALATRTLLETVITGAVGVALGALILQLVYPGPFVEAELLAFVLVVVVLAVPVQTILRVRGTWTGRRVAANRADRVEDERRVRIRRIAVEATVIALSIAAFVSLATRGLLETRSSGVDLLLAVAPLLFAGSVSIVILRVYRWPLALGIAAGRRSVGALGLLAAVRAQKSIAVLPLLALSLAMGLAVTGGLLASTVSAGQETASWQRIGADVRIHSTASAGQVATIASKPGVTGATAIGVTDGVQLRLSAGTNFATMISIDSRYPAFVRSLPTAGANEKGAAALRQLATTKATGDTLPVVVDRDLASQISTKNVGMYIGVKFVFIRVVGVTDEMPSGYLDSPFVFVDRTALAAQLDRVQKPTQVLVNGPGALAAARTLGAKTSAIETRASWLSERRSLALVHGVDEAITVATLSTALLAVLALIVTLLSGARERGRSLALVRTLGLPARLGWWLALAELAPVLVAAVVGGVLAGTGIVVLLEPAMGLGQLAGGLGDPAPTVSLGLIAGLVGTAVGLLLAAALIEIAVRRRDRLSEVLRVGESL